jgi:hypothetical protein
MLLDCNGFVAVHPTVHPLIGWTVNLDLTAPHTGTRVAEEEDS